MALPPEEKRIEVKVGDITTLQVDAVVNAANSSLLGGGGVDGAIHRKGGPAILAACKKIRAELYPKGLPTGQAAVTEAGNLPVRYVIHTVGPIWQGGNEGEAGLLASAYQESLLRANELDLKTVAFPAISTGVYGYPKEDAARIAYRVVKNFLASHEFPGHIIFIFFTPEDAEIFSKANNISNG